MPLSLFAGLRPVNRSRVVRDLIAGVSLASINIPQVLGYARIARMPVVTGLYTVLLPLVAFAVFGSSRHLVVAADSATAAIFSSSLARMAAPGSGHYMALVSTVALLTAGLLLAARIFKLGFLADFLSRTVLVGFLTGVGFQVAIAMLSDMCGVAVGSRYSLVQLWEVLSGLPQPHLPTLALSTSVAGAILLGHRFAPRLPLSMIAVLGTIWASAAFHFADDGNRAHRSRPRGAALVQAACRDLERNAGAAAHSRLLLRDDHRAKRRDRARFRGKLSRERR